MTVAIVILALVAVFGITVGFVAIEQNVRTTRSAKVLEAEYRATIAIFERAPEPEPEPSWWEEMNNRLVLIHLLDDDRTLRGLIVKVKPDGVLLSSVEYLGEGPPVPLGGDLYVEKDRIRFTQVPPEAKPVSRRRTASRA